MRESLEISGNDGQLRTFPTLDDFRQERPDLMAADGGYNPDAVVEVFRQWFLSGQSSCMFARDMAKKPTAHRTDWVSTCVPTRLSDGAMRKMLAQTVGLHPKATQITFPYVQTAAEVGELLGQLIRQDGWYAVELDVVDDVTLIGLRWSGVGDGYVTWALGFAPLPTMPVTRRAPFAAIIMRTVTTYGEIERKTEIDRTVVHLADFCKSKGGPKWDKTHKMRQALVEESRDKWAKAKVAFALPSEAVRDLTMVTL